MRFLGIDPGASGALCIYSPEASVASGLRWHFLDVPVTGLKSAKRVNAPALREWLMRFTPDRCLLELVNPMPGQGSSTTAIFIGISRAIEAVVGACDVPYISKTPVWWKNRIGVPNVPRSPGDTSSQRTRKLKEASRAHAIHSFPELGPMLARVQDADRAEAALMAALCSRLSP